MKSNLYKRSRYIINLKQYNKRNKLDDLGKVELNTPKERQYILRMLIKKPNTNYELPDKYNWVTPLLEKAVKHQKDIGINQPFCYLTIRSGIVNSQTDDEWHVDGFSLRTSHLPEQNYIWSDKFGTEYIDKKFNIPKDFDGLKYNINNLLSIQIKDIDIKKCNEKTLYALDPYILHRRKSESNNKYRTFVRISFTPIEINDINNTFNELIPTKYTEDGIKFRNKLLKY